MPMTFTCSHISSFHDFKPAMISCFLESLQHRLRDRVGEGQKSPNEERERDLSAPLLYPIFPHCPQYIADSPLDVLEDTEHGLQDGRDPKQRQALGPRWQDTRVVTPSR